MKELRECIERLRALKGRDAVVLHTYRLVVTAQARFKVNSIIRAEPVLPLSRVERPGTLPENTYLLQWADKQQAEKPNQFTLGGLGVDFAAVLGLASGRKVAFADEISLRREDASFLTFLPLGVSLDGELYGPVKENVEQKTEIILQALAALPTIQADSLGGSIRMRNAACCLVDSDHSTAYGLLVMAIEVLSERFGEAPNTWDDWDQAPKWNTFAAINQFRDEQVQALRLALIGDKRVRLRRAFIEYASNNLNDEFWSAHYFGFTPSIELAQNTVSWLDKEGQVHDEGTMGDIITEGPAILKKRLGKSYDARSSYVHRGVRVNQLTSLVRHVGTPSDPMPFSSLRRILDHLLWKEIKRGAATAPVLPEGRIIGPEGTAVG